MPYSKKKYVHDLLNKIDLIILQKPEVLIYKERDFFCWFIFQNLQTAIVIANLDYKRWLQSSGQRWNSK